MTPTLQQSRFLGSLFVGLALSPLAAAQGQIGNAPPRYSDEQAARQSQNQHEAYRSAEQTRDQERIFINARGHADSEFDGILIALDGRKLDVLPRALKKRDPEYPDFLLNRGAVHGSAQVEFTVGEKGDLSTPKILALSHPAFLPPVMEALFKTAFAPGRIAGTAVPSLLRWNVHFEVTVGRWDEVVGYDAIYVPSRSGPNTPAEFQYDKPPRVVLLCEPVYPFEQMIAGAKGEVEVSYVVDRMGRVAAATVTKATRAEFGAALVAAVETWRFSPPTLAGKPTMALLSWKQRFSPDNRELPADAGGKSVIKQLRAGEQKFVELAALDRKPRALYQVAPGFPRLLEERQVAGAAEIEFVIDREGRVRAPRVAKATHEEFGWAAATAVQQWFYEPPLVKGQPVDARVQVPFSFVPQPRGK